MNALDILDVEIKMSGYVVKVGKKGELYTPKKLRLRIGLEPGSEFIAVVKGEEVILS